MESHLWPAAIENAKASVGGAGLARMLVVRMRVLSTASPSVCMLLTSITDNPLLLQVGGLLYHLYNQASYMVLDLPGTSPVTLSVVRSHPDLALCSALVPVASMCSI